MIEVTLMATVEDLEERVKHLEFQLGLTRKLTVRENYPFGQYALDAGMTEDLYHSVFGLVEEADKHVTSGGQMTFWEFVEKVYAAAPERGKDGKFARNILNALHDGGQFPELYEHMMQHGMMAIS